MKYRHRDDPMTYGDVLDVMNEYLNDELPIGFREWVENQFDDRPEFQVTDDLETEIELLNQRIAELTEQIAALTPTTL